jgi:hypothetical protein
MVALTIFDEQREREWRFGEMAEKLDDIVGNKADANSIWEKLKPAT